MQRPENVTDKHLKFLDSLRESGTTNMLGASPYLRDRFGISKKEADQILFYWMETLDNDDR